MFFLQDLLNKLTDLPSSHHSASTRTVSLTTSPPNSNATNSSAFENFTRTIRGYVPASVTIPSFEPSPLLFPSPTRYVSAGSFSSHRPPKEHRTVVSQQEFDRDYERQDDSDDDLHHGYGGQHLSSMVRQSLQSTSRTKVSPLSDEQTLRVTSSGLAQAMQRSVHLQKSTPEPINWARWDVLYDR